MNRKLAEELKAGRVDQLCRPHAREASRPTCSSRTRASRLGGAALLADVAAVADFHFSLPPVYADPQEMKHKPDQAFEHQEVFCFLLVCHRALPDLQRFQRAALKDQRNSRGRQLTRA